MNWLIDIKELDLAREMLKNGIKQDQCTLVNAAANAPESFVLELLQGQPDRSLDNKEQHFLAYHPAIPILIEHNKMLAFSTMLSMRFKVSDLIYRDVMQDSKKRDFPTRLAILNLLTHHSVPLDYNFFSNVMGTPESEHLIWFDWGVRNGARRCSLAIINSINSHGDKYFTWFKEHGFIPNDLHFLHSCPKTEQQSQNRVQALKTMGQLWPRFIQSSSEAALQLAIEAFDWPLVKYLWDEVGARSILRNDGCMKIFLHLPYALQLVEMSMRTPKNVSNFDLKIYQNAFGNFLKK
jgi:hypothetical protein